MATTDRHAYPYPLGNDYVVDGDNAIRALAESLDAGPVIMSGNQSGATNGLGIIGYEIPAAIRTNPRLAVKALILTPINVGNDPVSVIFDLIIWDQPPYAQDRQYIQIRARRQDSHQWLADNTVSFFWVVYAS